MKSNDIILTFLIARTRRDGYIGMCRETGVIRGGKSVEEVENRLDNATQAIMDTVGKDGKYLASLHSGLPFRYRTLFYISIMKVFTKKLIHTADDMMLFTRSVSAFGPQYA